MHTASKTGSVTGLGRAGLLLAALSLSGLAPPARAQTAADLFDDSVLHEIRLYMHPDDWQLLHTHYLENTYYPADVQWRNEVAYDAGVRSRGLGSRSPIKPGLRVDLNRYTKGQRFLGLTSFILDNAAQDVSFLREPLCMRLFRHMGFSAPREAYTRLYVNNTYIGLYIIIEDITKDFLRRNFDEDAGYLYEYKWTDEYRFEYLGPKPEPYLVKFKPVTHEKKPDASILEEMIRMINQASDEEFAVRIPEFLDPNTLVTYLAVENFVAEFDGILGDWGMNNFYLYRREDQKRFTFIPWDKDVTCSRPDHPIDYNLTTNVLVRRLMASPELRRAYLEALRAVAFEAGGPGGWLEERLDRAYRLLRSAALDDTAKGFSNEAFEDHVALVREFVRNRAETVLLLIEPALASMIN